MLVGHFLKCDINMLWLSSQLPQGCVKGMRTSVGNENLNAYFRKTVIEHTYY